MRTRIVAGGPQRVAVTVDRQVRVRVAGVAYGFVRCRGERRWVWGRFDLTFRVSKPSAGKLTVVAWGLGGRASYSVEVGPLHDLRAPLAPRLLPLPRVRPRVPRVAPLSAATIARIAAGGS